MGGQVSKLMSKIFGSKEMRILMLGLDAAGKTSKPLAVCDPQRVEVLTRTLSSSNPLQIETEPGCDHDPHSRIQR
jgi:hypothetical protein